MAPLSPNGMRWLNQSTCFTSVPIFTVYLFHPSTCFTRLLVSPVYLFHPSTCFTRLPVLPVYLFNLSTLIPYPFFFNPFILLSLNKYTAWSPYSVNNFLEIHWYNHKDCFYYSFFVEERFLILAYFRGSQGVMM